MYFSAGLSFYLNDKENAIKPSDLRHITSTATCYASLLQCPDLFRSSALPQARIHLNATDKPTDVLSLDEKARRFANGILNKKVDEWISDKSARVYCECRALPFAVRMASGWHASIQEHVEHAMKQLEIDPQRAAIGEADPSGKQEEWYPPNAYHTYWLLRALRLIQERFPEEFGKLSVSLSLDQRVARMMQWARQILAYQVALHNADSSTLDSDQLAWSLSIICSDPHFNETRLEEQDFVREALKCLFGTQTKVGTWRHYAPLFHYEASGNAYCYVFETFAALLEESLRPGEHFLRHALKGHCGELLRLWSYARITQHPHPDDSNVLLWSSEHRMNQTHPESWATASVFEYAQALRRLVGIWTREEAERQLPSGHSDSSQNEARITLEKRSVTWTLGEGFADRLFPLFVYPRDVDNSEPPNDPDNQPIRENYARSAILYGPPGASKTTMIQSLAASIGWKYVELHSSHFVAEGLPLVQKTADAIFRRLYELDHAVILFDEIDELVREREKEDEASGRFLTTSMLPKLAELWKNRKVMYFVATNHIEFFDKAITRAQRFDAVWFVSPPSFEAKISRLQSLLSNRWPNIHFHVKETVIDDVFGKVVTRARAMTSKEREVSELKEDELLAKFKMLRFDELDELSARIRDNVDASGAVDETVLKGALGAVKDGKWRSLAEYLKFEDDQKYQRRDYGKVNLWKVSDSTGAFDGVTLIDAKTGKYVEAAAEDSSEVAIPNFQANRTGVGTIRLEPKRKMPEQDNVDR
jgi:hypothetical protein